MELTLDIFRNDAFSVVNLQRVVDNAPYVPQELEALNLFEPHPLDTDVVLLYEKDGGYALIPTRERGSPWVHQIRRQGRLRALKTTALGKKDSVRASELMGIANQALPENIRLRNAMDLINDRTTQLQNDMSATKELHRLGALQGKLLDADGTTVIYNYFAAYGIPDPTVVNINFSTIAKEALVIYLQDNFLRPIITVLKQRATPQTRLGCLMGDGAWAKMLQNPLFYDVYKAQLTAGAAASLVDMTKPNMWNRLDFAGVTWINYRGSTSGDIAIGFNDMRFFPIGAKDVFMAYWAPGETLLDVMDKGRPAYLYVQPDPNDRMPMFVDIVVASYPLYACIFPASIMYATATG